MIPRGVFRAAIFHDNAFPDINRLLYSRLLPYVGRSEIEEIVKRAFAFYPRFVNALLLRPPNVNRKFKPVPPFRAAPRKRGYSFVGGFYVRTILDQLRYRFGCGVPCAARRRTRRFFQHIFVVHDTAFKARPRHYVRMIISLSRKPLHIALVPGFGRKIFSHRLFAAARAHFRSIHFVERFDIP